MASSASTGDVFYLNKGTIFDRLFTSTISSISSTNLIDTAANYNIFDQDQQLNETFTSSSPIFHLATTTEIANNSCLPLIDRQLQNALVIFSVICMVIINLVIIFGNLLVILSVFLYTKLRSVTNFFIVSLAVADLLIGVAVVPYSLTQNISKAWYFGKVWCIGWLVTDVWLSTSSILNLVAISIDRYIAITRPLKYRTMMTPKRAKYLIACAWILSFFICFPPLVLHGQEGSYGLMISKINLSTPNSIDSQKKSHPSSYSSSILSLNQNPFNSFTQQTIHTNSELNTLSTNRQILNKFFHNSDISQRNKKDRDSEFGIVTSAPLIFDPNLVWLNENKFKQDKFNKRKFKRESNSISNPTNYNLYNRLKNKKKLNLENKYKKFKLHKELNKQSVNYKHFKRWKRELINDNNPECEVYTVLQCILFDSKGYVIYSAVGSFFIPMFIMIFFYWRIYLVAMYTTKALNRGYISNKSIRANPMAILTGSKSEIAASNLQKSIAGSTQFSNLDNSNSDMVSSNLTLRVHRGYMKDQQAPTQLNLANDLNRKSTNRSSYDSTGRQSSTSTTVTIRANSTIDTTTAAQLCRRLLPTRLSNRILSKNDAKQLRKIQHRSVRCLDRTQNVVTLAVDATRPRTIALKRTQSEQCIDLNKSDENLNKNLDKNNTELESKNTDHETLIEIQKDANDDKEKDEKDEKVDKNEKINNDKNPNKIEIINNKLSDLIENSKFESKIRLSNSEKNIKSKLQLIKQYSLSSSNLLNGKDQQKFIFKLKDENNLKQNASQIQLNIVPPQDTSQDSKLNSQIKCDENDQLIPKDDHTQNGYHEINNNLNKTDLIENLDTSNQLGNNLTNSQNTYHLTTSGSTKSKYLSYWSRFSKKRSNLNKNPNQNTNSSGKFQAKRFIAETKAAKTVGIIVGCFWCCWFPFFTVYLTRGLCEDKNCIPEILLTIFTWLGYINSALNPIIYGMFSKDFRRAFKNIICKCKFSEETGISTLIRQIHLPNLFEDENMI